MRKLIANQLLAGVVALGSCVNISAEEYGQVLLQGESGWQTETVEIKSGALFKVLTARKKGGNSFIAVEYQGKRIQLRPPELTQDDRLFNVQIIGPATIIFTSYGGETLFASYVINESNQTSSNYALVLPEGEDGKQKLVLESSTDLVNWTEDSLGSKDSSDKKRFYRLRAVKE